MLIITGATGQLGKLITEKLLDRLPAAQVGVSVRDPEKARFLSERGVRVRQSDFADAGKLRHAFEGASQVLIVSANTTGETAKHLHRTAIEAARATDARRILDCEPYGFKSGVPVLTHAGSRCYGSHPQGVRYRFHFAAQWVLRGVRSPAHGQGA